LKLLQLNTSNHFHYLRAVAFSKLQTSSPNQRLEDQPR
jgi:hypothetical protein